MTVEKNRFDAIYEDRKRMAQKYSLDNPGNRFNYQVLRRKIETTLESVFDDLPKVRLLDLGAGTMHWVNEFSHIGLSSNNCFGVDLLLWRLREGKRAGRDLSAVVCSADNLPFADRSFDLITQLTLMTSVLDRSDRERIVSEAFRVLKPGGFFLWYDFRYSNPGNKFTRGIGRKEIEQLFPDTHISIETVTLLPQLARKLIGPTVPLLKFFYRLPILRTHYLALIGPKR